MRILVFDAEISGHHLEYVNNIFSYCKNSQQNKFIFVIPKIDVDKNEFDWTKSENIIFRFLDEDEIARTKGALLKKSFYGSFLIKKIAKEQQADKIILINFAPVIPILPLIMPKSIKLRGIIYQIYLWKPKKGIRKIIDFVRYKVLSKSKSVEKVFILNDHKSASALNKIYKTHKFEAIPDPLPNVYGPDLDIRQKYKISEDSIVFLHFGAMSERKGTLDILNAIKLLSPKNNYTFIFAGRVNEDIRNEFYKLYLDIKKSYNIIFIDDFCSYSCLEALCKVSHCILIPYHITSQSSGLIGHASRHKIPVIGPADGLIGYLIDKYNLGKSLPRITPYTIAKAIQEYVPYNISNDYANLNTIKQFQNILMN